jgi:hypothetical protein
MDRDEAAFREEVDRLANLDTVLIDDNLVTVSIGENPHNPEDPPDTAFEARSMTGGSIPYPGITTTHTATVPIMTSTKTVKIGTETMDVNTTAASLQPVASLYKKTARAGLDALPTVAGASHSAARDQALNVAVTNATRNIASQLSGLADQFR